MNRAGRRDRLSPSVEGLEGRTLMAAPVLDAIQLDPGATNITLPTLKSRLVPLTATDADGDTLTYTVTSNNANIKASVLTGGTFLKLTYQGFGEMTFRLLPEYAPNTTQIMAGLAGAGKFDGTTLHRIVKDFVIQGGDPTASGSGSLVNFEYGDEFHPDAQFTGRGQLAMANSGEDTNGSQYFVTMGQPRHLDFKHTIFGQLLRGFDVLDKLNNASLVGTRLTSAQIIQDNTDAVLVIDSVGAGSATLTVKADDGHGGVSTRTVIASTFTDSTNNRAILHTTGNRATRPGVSVAVLAGVDPEGDAFTVTPSIVDNPANGTVQYVNNQVIVTPTPGFVGTINVRAQIFQGANSTLIDTVNLPVYVQTLTSQGVDLNAVEGSTISGTVATFQAGVPFTASNFTATINWGDGTPTTQGTIQAAPGGASGSYIVTASKAYARYGDRAVTITITDTTSGFTTSTLATAKVSDAPIQATFTPPQLTPGSGTFTGAVAVFADANPNQTSDITAKISWGDGTTQLGIVVRLPDQSYAVFYDGTKTYAALGSYTVTVTIESTGGSKDIVSGTLTVPNRAPIIAEPSLQPVDEGGLMVLDLAKGGGDPDLGQKVTYSLSQSDSIFATVDSDTGEFRWMPERLGNSTFTVVASDDFSPPMKTSRSFVVNVRPVAPSVSVGGSAAISQFDGFSRAGRFTDPGSGPWTATVDYGDGSGRQPLVVAADKSFVLNHNYDSAGSFAAVVEVTDPSGLKGTTSVPIQVAAIPAVRVVSATNLKQRTAIIGFNLVFDAALDSGSANNALNFSIVGAGRDKKFGTRDDVVTKLRVATLNPDGRSIRLTTAKKLIPAGALQLRANGLKDARGRLIDGDRDGNPGGTFAATITKAGLKILSLRK